MIPKDWPWVPELSHLTNLWDPEASILTQSLKNMAYTFGVARKIELKVEKASVCYLSGYLLSSNFR